MTDDPRRSIDPMPDPPPGPHDVPTVAQLVVSVREWLDRDVLPATDGRLRFHARVAANILGIVDRELALGPAQTAAHRARLDALGVADDAELASLIRRREIVEDEELRKLLRESVVDKLRVANPGHLSSGS